MLSDRINRGNLLKLAQYLEALPLDYDKFEMKTFFEIADDGDIGFVEAGKIKSAGLIVCGTVGCAIGHGPSAGIQRLKDEDWIDYSYRQFVDVGFKRLGDEEEVYEADDIWQWCFAATWTRIDNTPHGAAKRIRWYLDHGLPFDAVQQIHWKTELCYAAAEQKGQQP